MHRKTLLFTVVFTLTTISQAQTSVPPKQLEALKPYFGSWAGKLDVMGQQMDSTMSVKSVHGGHFVLFESATGPTDGTHTTESFYVGWDATKNTLTGWAFTGMSPEPRTEILTLTGKTLSSLSAPWKAYGMVFKFRTTMELKSESELDFRVEVELGNQWQPAGGGLLKKQS